MGRFLYLAALAVVCSLIAQAGAQSPSDVTRECAAHESQIGRVLAVDAGSDGAAYIDRPTASFRIPVSANCGLRPGDRIIAQNVEVTFEHCGARRSLSNGEEMLPDQSCGIRQLLPRRRGSAVVQNEVAQPQLANASVGVQGRAWTGYAQQVEERRAALEAGAFDLALQQYASDLALQQYAFDRALEQYNANEAGRQPDALQRLEVATLALDSGNLEPASRAFAVVEQPELLSLRSRLSILGRQLRRSAALLSGNDTAPYQPADYELVLQHSYMALTALIAGDASGLGLGRPPGERVDSAETPLARAMRLQDDALATGEQMRERVRSMLQFEEGSVQSEIVDQVSAAYLSEDNCPAVDASHSSENPLPAYLTGVAMEISSAVYADDRVAARANYLNAARLIDQSTTLAAALRDTAPDARSPPERLVQVLIAEGQAPTPQALRVNISANGQIVPVELPRLTCHASPVSRIELRAVNGRLLGRFEPLVSVERMMLAHQRDMEEATTLAVLNDVLRGQAMAELDTTAQLMVGLAGASRADSRSWSTLPARFFMIRARVPERERQVIVTTLDRRGAVLSRRTVDLDITTGHNFIYGRVSNTSIATQLARPWMQAP